MSDEGIVVLGIPIPSSSPLFLSIVAVHVVAGLICTVAHAPTNAANSYEQHSASPGARCSPTTVRSTRSARGSTPGPTSGTSPWACKRAGKSMAIIEGVRNPVKGYYQSLIEHKTLPGPNPAADLSYFVGKQGKRKRTERAARFSREEAPQLVATATA